MTRKPQRAAGVVELNAGASAVAPGLLFLHGSRTLVAADVHFGYEDVIGAAVPLWSTAEMLGILLRGIASLQARELVLLGDAIHGSRMSEGAARGVRAALDRLRAGAQLTIVAGNHEGRSRGAAILGETSESAIRDGWLLLHGDKVPPLHESAPAKGIVIGHLHPSLPLGGRSSPAFLAAKRLMVVPALTPYSSGLNVFSDDCLNALRAFGTGSRADLHLVAAAGDMLYPFGTLSKALRAIRL